MLVKDIPCALSMCHVIHGCKTSARRVSVCDVVRGNVGGLRRDSAHIPFRSIATGGGLLIGIGAGKQSAHGGDIGKGGGRDGRRSHRGRNAGTVLILLLESGGDIVIKRNHDVFLRVLAEPFPSVPACGAEGARRIYEPGKGLGKGLLLHELGFGLVNLICGGIVLIADGLGGGTVEIEEIGFHVCLNELAVETGAPHLLSDRGFGRKGGVVVLGRRSDLVATRTGCDTYIVSGLASIILAPGERLVLQRFHSLLLFVFSFLKTYCGLPECRELRIQRGFL